jgi:hypothetical protein
VELSSQMQQNLNTCTHHHQHIKSYIQNPLWAVSIAAIIVLYRLLCCHGKVITLVERCRPTKHPKFVAGIKNLITELFIKNESSIILLNELHIISRFCEAFLKAKLTCFKQKFNCIPYDILPNTTNYSLWFGPVTFTPFIYF